MAGHDEHSHTIPSEIMTCLMSWVDKVHNIYSQMGDLGRPRPAHLEQSTLSLADANLQRAHTHTHTHTRTHTSKPKAFGRCLFRTYPRSIPTCACIQHACDSLYHTRPELGARLRVVRQCGVLRTVLRRVLGKDSQKGSWQGACCGSFTVKRVLRRGSEKGVSRRVHRTPPRRVRLLRRAPTEKMCRIISTRPGQSQ